MSKKKRPSIDDYLTVPQAIEDFDIQKSTMYHWLRYDDLPSDMVGSTKIILRKDMEKFYNIKYP